MASSSFTPEQLLELRRVARSAAAGVAGISWDDSKDQPMETTRRQEKAAALVAEMKRDAQ